MPQTKTKRTRTAHAPYDKSKNKPMQATEDTSKYSLDSLVAEHQNKIYTYVEDEMMRRAQHDGLMFGVLKRSNVVKSKERKATLKEKAKAKEDKYEKLREEMLKGREERSKNKPIVFEAEKQDDENVFSF